MSRRGPAKSRKCRRCGERKLRSKFYTDDDRYCRACTLGDMRKAPKMHCPECYGLAWRRPETGCPTCGQAFAIEVVELPNRLVSSAGALMCGGEWCDE